jgi:hypothetical protein
MESNTRVLELGAPNLLIEPTNNQYLKCLIHMLYFFYFFTNIVD